MVVAENVLIPPIHRIPVELLGEIFKHFLDEEPLARREKLSSSTVTSGYLKTVNPIILGHVCSHWRAVSLSTPLLWSSLAIYRPKLSQIPLIRLWLKRSAACPLDLSLSHASDGDVTQTIATKRILAYFIRCVRRWKTIRLSLFDEVPYAPLLYLPPGVPAMLESAHLDLPCWDYADIDRLWSIMHSSPSLRRVAWGSEYEFAEIPRHVPWAQLTRINARNTITARPEDLLQALRLSTNLVDLNVSTSWPHTLHSHTFATPIVLPSLRHLKICSEDSNSSTLLTQMNLPALTSLDLYHSSFSCSSQQDAEPYSHLKDFLSRSKCSLQHLSLFDQSVTCQDVAGVLSSQEMKTAVSVFLSLSGPTEKCGSVAERAQ